MGGERGRRIEEKDKIEALALIKEARAAGARLGPVCEVLEITERTLQRWVKKTDLKDGRHGPLTAPRNKLTETERERVLCLLNSEEYRDLSPKQIVPKLADQSCYIASESTMYRILREEKMLAHRRAERPNTHTRPPELSATKPNQVWSWDITYLASTVRGLFYYFYLFLDVFSRKIVGYEVHEEQKSEVSSETISRICASEGISPKQITLHSDNGGPMKGAVMMATLEALGVVPSFSRPSVSNDNSFSEAIFKTFKYRPGFDKKHFDSLSEAREWVESFVNWYNTVHQHSGISFVTPQERHEGKDLAIIEQRKAVYELAKEKNPARWAKNTRNWKYVKEVSLNKRNAKSETTCSCLNTHLAQPEGDAAGGVSPLMLN